MKAINIKWDTDGDMELLKELPTEIDIPEEIDDEDEISDYISDVTGFCHFGFEVDGQSFTAFVYEDDGTTVEDLSTYDTEEEAIEFAKNHKWDEVVNDNTGKVVWKRI